MGNVEMVMVQRLNNVYVPSECDVLEIPRARLARMQQMITVECEVGGRLFQEQLVGYREADSGCVMVDYEQFERNFS